ncbi:MAG: hypothetical protein HOP08_15965 [Cyclobacteriaceae bacterium]|nr:hypothetical protein [Cyclobacteriaceae bacterium]
MKKITLIFCALILIQFTSMGQGRSTIRFGVGYGFPVASTVTGTNYNYNYQAGSYNYENVYDSYGSGLTLNLGYSIRFGKPSAEGKLSLGADLDVQGLYGKKISANNRTVDESFGTFRTTNTVTSNSIEAMLFTPSIVFYIPVKSVEFYYKVGPTGGISKRYTETISDEVLTGNQQEKNHYERKLEATGQFTVGVKSSLGIAIPVGTRWSFFGEVNLTILDFRPDKGKLTVNTRNGVNQIVPPVFDTVYYTQFNYIYKYIYSDPNSFDAPYRYPIDHASLTNLGFQFGVGFRL